MYMLRARLLTRLSSTPKPFQFLMVWVPGLEEFPMSVSMYSDDGVVQIVFKVRGRGTHGLASLGPGQFMGFRGPFGRGLETANVGNRVLMVAGGVGIAPVPYAAKVLQECGVYVDVVWGVKDSNELFDPSLIGLELHGREVMIATEDGSRGFKGTVVELMAKVVAEDRNRYDTIIGIGPKAMLREMCRVAKELGVVDRVWVSIETTVKCGMGICGSCCLRPLPKLLCRDGPLFRCIEVEEFLSRSS